ncbi:MAG TPA: AmmeMemoRadiSam system protein B [Bacteroidota bacterium]|nr:AmmeMemoRadiSam system protein B [Bacteroidota bacterium]
MKQSAVRPAAVAGTFYPSERALLAQTVDELLERASDGEPPEGLKGLIVPHAGFQYSGYTAAQAFALLRDQQFDTVFVVGPSHREYFEGISISPHDAYHTPLGDVPVNHEFRKKLVDEAKRIVISPDGHRAEHCIEVQLPFLQRVLKSFSLVPIIIGDQHREFCESLAEVLSSVGGISNALLVASSDLSHYHPYDDAVRLDRVVIDDVETFRPDSLIEKLELSEAEACGGGPIVSVMMAARSLGAGHAHILHYCNSGDVTGDKARVVGYLSAALAGVH